MTTGHKVRRQSMERFSTNRLSAEKLREDHLADLVDLHLDPQVARYLGGVRSPETTKAYLADNMAHWDRHGFGLWVLRTKIGEFAGRAGIRHVSVEGIDEIEIVYTLSARSGVRGSPARSPRRSPASGCRTSDCRPSLA